jgi:hypothetical protein
MPNLEEDGRLEYTALMNRGRDAEKTAQLCWTAGGVGAAVMMSWAIGSKSPGLMIPVELAIAVGFYATLRGRQQVRWIASYIEQFCENHTGPQWFTRVHRLQNLPGYKPVGDWLTVCLANVGILISVMLSWMYAAGTNRGDLMAEIVTACGVAFAFHSISETIRLGQTDGGAMWRQVSGELREAPRDFTDIRTARVGGR